jgi:Tol biopolymer transport system component
MGSRRRSRRVVVSSFFLIASFGAGAQAQSIVRVDVANDGSEAIGGVDDLDVSDDGTKVVFSTYNRGLDPADVNFSMDVLLRDVVAGTTALVSVGSHGEIGDGNSTNPRITPDGRFVAFESVAKNLVDGDMNDAQDIFVRDRVAGTTTRVNVASDGTEANGWNYVDAISADGNLVLFESYASNLVADDTNGYSDLFLHDVAAGTTIRVSTAADGTEGDSWSYGGDLSRDGRSVAFASYASNLIAGDTNGTLDVFVRDLVDGTVTRASVDSNGVAFVTGGGNPGVARSGIAFSPDGTLVAFPSLEVLAGSGDDNDAYDVFVRDQVLGTTTVESTDSNGKFSRSGQYGQGSWATGVSSDGKRILMDSVAVDLAANEISNPDTLDVYVRDRALAMTTRQSNDSSGSAGNRRSFGSRMTPDGSRVAFVSSATNLIDGHPTQGSCAFLRTRPDRAAASSGYGSGLAGTFGVPSFDLAAPPVLNQPFDVALGNSLGKWTLALFLIGTQSQDLPSGLGGDLLVVPQWTQLFVVGPAGFDLTGTIPPEEQLTTLSFFLQALELDAGAPKGVSFTAGLELDVGF